ncbi:MAG: ABC-2 transporter permease [Flavobacteriales bacterium]|nr:ABC transporter permease subunit [Flavobacteriales bacterium]
MRALILKELRGFLGSLIGQIVVVVFLLLTGLFLWVFPNNILDSGYADLAPLFFIAPWVFLFLVPAITMRSFSEEKRNGTIEFLLTKPLSEMHVVLAKYGAAVLLVLFALLPTLIYVWVVDHLALAHIFPSDAVASSIALRTWSVAGIMLAFMIWSVFRKRSRSTPKWTTAELIQAIFIRVVIAGAVALVVHTLLSFSGIDQGATWGSYIGLFLLAACFAAIGVFASSLTDSQIVAFLIAVFISFFLYLGFDLIASFQTFGALEGIIRSIGIQSHYESMSRGVIDLRDVLYYLGVITVFVLLTRTVLQSRKW